MTFKVTSLVHTQMNVEKTIASDTETESRISKSLVKKTYARIYMYKSTFILLYTLFY